MPSKINALKCKYCSGDLELNFGDTIIRCPYCGTTYRIDPSIYDEINKKIERLRVKDSNHEREAKLRIEELQAQRAIERDRALEKEKERARERERERARAREIERERERAKERALEIKRERERAEEKKDRVQTACLGVACILIGVLLMFPAAFYTLTEQGIGPAIVVFFVGRLVLAFGKALTN